MNILITGCYSGLGKSIWDTLKNKHVVIPHFRLEDKDVPFSITGDLNDITTIDHIENTLKSNKIDVFINNAAKYINKNFINCSDEDIEIILRSNLITPALLLRRVCSWFLSSNKGLIININSIGGLVPSIGESLYCASKNGLSNLSKILQMELKGTNVRVLDLYLGAIKTPMSNWRKDYNSLIEPIEVAQFISNFLDTPYSTMNPTEIILRKK